MMGFLDSLIGGLNGTATQGQSALLQVALQLVQQSGGLPGIISKLLLSQAISVLQQARTN